MTETTNIQQDLEDLRALKLSAVRAKEYSDKLAREFKLKQHHIYERMRGQRVKSMNVNGINYVRASTVYGQVQDEGAFLDWAAENRPDLTVTKPYKKEVNALARECLNDGTPMPPGLGAYEDEYIQQRGGKADE